MNINIPLVTYLSETLRNHLTNSSNSSFRVEKYVYLVANNHIGEGSHFENKRFKLVKQGDGNLTIWRKAYTLGDDDPMFIEVFKYHYGNSEIIEWGSWLTGFSAKLLAD